MKIVWTLFLALCVLQGVTANADQLETTPKYTVGVNKFDLPKHYIGRIKDEAGGDSYRRVSRSLARKSLADARDIGVRLMRASMVGYGPSAYGKPGDLDLWRTKPDEFWSRMDGMMDDLDANEIRLVPTLMWNPKQFPAMTGETVGDLIRNPNSKSWKLLSAFVTDFVTRYRNRKTIEFYELSNELNLLVDIDNIARCNEVRSEEQCDISSNFSTDELISFTRRYADLIRSMDNKRLISSGFSIPRGAAEHLRARSAQSRRGPDWGQDTREQFSKNLRDIHSAVDIISIHLYQNEKNQRFGSDELALLAEAKRVADALGKPLFVGEFGNPKPVKAGPDSHTARMLKKIIELRVPYSAVWVWEYRRKDYLIQDGRPDGFSLDPGYTDYLIDRIQEANLGLRKSVKGHQRKDGQAPRVVLTWPLECASLTNPTDIYAVASDDSGTVKKVEFLIEGKVLDVDEAPPYKATFSPSIVGAGKHRLTARAYDRSGNAADFSTYVVTGTAAGTIGNCTISEE